MKKTPMCKLCGKVFSRRDNLERHLNNHQGEKLFFCEYCGKSFLRKSYLKLHHRIHSGERPFQCGVCGRTFTRDDHLLRHRRSHQGYKPYTCDVCGKALSRRDHLAVHRRIHTGERPFKCDLCNCEFTRNEHLSKHKKLNLCEQMPPSCVITETTLSTKMSEFDKEDEQYHDEPQLANSNNNSSSSKHHSKNNNSNDGSSSSSNFSNTTSSHGNSCSSNTTSKSVDSKTLQTPQSLISEGVSPNTAAIIAAPALTTGAVTLVTNDFSALLPNTTKLYSIPCNGSPATGILADSAGTGGMATQIYQTATGVPNTINPITHIFPTIQLSPATTQIFPTIQMYPSTHINLQQHTPLNQKLHISSSILNHSK